MTWKSNPWVKFLEGYCTGQNQIQDEYVRKVAKRLGINEFLDIKFPWQQEILDKFNSRNEYNLIILTGTAGDGKTKLCRDIVKALDGDKFNENDWNSNSYISTEERTIVKDFSELEQKDKDSLVKEMLEILKTKKISKPILVAVNDGILVEDLEKFIYDASDEEDKKFAKSLKEIIEDKINLGFSGDDGHDLVNLINLSKLNAKENMSLVFDAILKHSGWNGCEGCIGKESQACTIYNKYSLLTSQPHIKENLSEIILLLQLNDKHFTIRELLNLATNTLLASVPKQKKLKVTEEQSKKEVMNCKEMSKIKTASLINSESSIEVGFWGMNFSMDKIHSTRPYSEIDKLNFGNLSTNYWDKQLKEKSRRGFSIPLDDKHSENSSSNNKFLGALIRRSRIQLYCYQKDNSFAFHLQKYFYFNEYKEKIYNALLDNKGIDIDIALIVLSLNRVFHGRYISEKSGKDHLFVPEKGQGSIAPISIFHAGDIREQYIDILQARTSENLSSERVEPVLNIEVDKGKNITISLTVELFDYLMNVAKGMPPNTTDLRLYKKLLILRSKISNNFYVRKNSRIDVYSIDNGKFEATRLGVKSG